MPRGVHDKRIGTGSGCIRRSLDEHSKKCSFTGRNCSVIAAYYESGVRLEFNGSDLKSESDESRCKVCRLKGVCGDLPPVISPET